MPGRRLSDVCEFPLLMWELRGVSGSRFRAGVWLVTAVLSLVFLLLSAAERSGVLRIRDHWALLGQFCAGSAVMAAYVTTAGAASISREREHRSLELLLLTRLTAVQVVWQKFAAVLVQSLLLVAPVFLLTALAYAAAGGSVSGLLVVWVLIFVVGVQLAASAVMCSALISSAAISLGVNWFLWMCLLAIPGVLDDVGFLPRWYWFRGAGSVLPILPFVHLVAGFRVVWTGVGVQEFVMSCVPALVLALVMLLVAVEGIRRWPGRALLNPQSVRVPRKWLECQASRLLCWVRGRAASGGAERQESRELPEFDSVRWRELARNPQTRLYPHLLYCVTVLAGVLWLRRTLTPLEFAVSLPGLQVAYGLLSILGVMVCVCESLAFERQQGTRDLLWLIPIRNVELLRQKLAGADRLLWLVMLSNLTLAAARMLLDPMSQRGMGWRAALYLLVGSGLLLLLLLLVKWLSVWQSLLSDSLLSALSRSMAVTASVFVAGMLPLTAEVLRQGGDPVVLQQRSLWCVCSPLLVWMAHLTRLLRWRGGDGVLLVMDIVGLVLWLVVLFYLRRFCLRLLGRVRTCDVEASFGES